MRTIQDFAAKWGTKTPGILLKELISHSQPSPSVVTAVGEMVADLEMVLKEVKL